MIIKCPTTTGEEKVKAQLELDIHVSAAINQQQAVKKIHIEVCQIYVLTLSACASARLCGRQKR